MVGAKYGRQVPVGARLPLTDQDHARELCERFPVEEPPPDQPLCTARPLAAAPSGLVVLVSLGSFHDLAALLDSPADRWSPLAGADLVRHRVRETVVDGRADPVRPRVQPGARRPGGRSRPTGACGRGVGRSSCDPVPVHVAVLGESEHDGYSEPGKVDVDTTGRSTWHQVPGGRHRLVLRWTADDAVAAAINALLAQLPRASQLDR